MRSKSTFAKLSGSIAIIALLIMAGLGGRSVQADPVAQGTGTATTAATTVASATAAATATTAATATRAATLSGTTVATATTAATGTATATASTAGTTGNAAASPTVAGTASRIVCPAGIAVGTTTIATAVATTSGTTSDATSTLASTMEMGGVATSTMAAAASTMAASEAPTMSASEAATMSATESTGAGAASTMSATTEAGGTTGATMAPTQEAMPDVFTHTGCLFMAQLEGKNETGGGAPDGYGVAIVTINPNTSEICYDIDVDNIKLPATMAHIHKGAAGVAGPVVIPFSVVPDESGSASNCEKLTDLATARAILANPSNYYVNVHTTDFPNGAIRGQLMGAVKLLGTNEKAGDPKGFGVASVTVDTTKGEVCYAIKVENITLPATADHIHKGAAGVDGPVVIPFPTAPDTDGIASGCTQADSAEIKAILANPAGYYVNVHNKDFPNGAVRGQLSAVQLSK